jgi:hypothetical protein
MNKRFHSPVLSALSAAAATAAIPVFPYIIAR